MDRNKQTLTNRHLKLTQLNHREEKKEKNGRIDIETSLSIHRNQKQKKKTNKEKKKKKRKKQYTHPPVRQRIPHRGRSVLLLSRRPDRSAKVWTEGQVCFRAAAAEQASAVRRSNQFQGKANCRKRSR